MKILYGVQGTGNGHISRARAMQKEFAKTDIEVDWLFSGRDKDKYFCMKDFKNSDYRKGLTFHVENGKVNYFKTALELDLKQFKKDIKSININNYDLIITDFEPITAWVGKKADIPVIGLGHQYVFDFSIPQKKGNIFSRFVLNKFAPVKSSLALHWHHFNQNILPPIVETHTHKSNIVIENKVLVYLPFENQHQVLRSLAPLKSFNFTVYAPKPINSFAKNVNFKPLSRDGFLCDLYNCDAVLANAGFELSSEVISLGKRLLVRPLDGQVEQHSNAIALEALKYGKTIKALNSRYINNELDLAERVQVNYPNVAEYIVKWIKNGMLQRDENWYSNIWQGVEVKREFSNNQFGSLVYN